MNFSVRYSSGETYNLPYRNSRLQDLSGGYRKGLGLSCQMPLDTGNGDNVLKITGLDGVAKVLWWASMPNGETLTILDAYTNTTNLGAVPVTKGEAVINFAFPSRYIEDGELRDPHIHLALCGGGDDPSLRVLTVDLKRESTQSWMTIFIVAMIFLVVILLWKK